MKITLLGTGAADGIPGFFSSDRVSKIARACGGKDVRTRAAALIDGSLKIDLGPDTLAQIHGLRLDPRDWTALFFTHSHEDHLAVSEIQYCLYPFTELEQLPFQIFGNETVRAKIAERYPAWPIDFVDLKQFQECSFADYRVTPVLAHHEPDEKCFNLLIERDRRLLYATDTGVWGEETFQFLEGKQIDCLVIECTESLGDSTYEGHLNIKTLTEVLARLRATAAVTKECVIITTHHASSGNASHEELEKALEPIGAIPGFDGMDICL